MQITNEVEEEIKTLNICFILHIIFYTLLFVIHLILCIIIHWLNNIIIKIFFFGTFFGISFFLFPIIPIYFICRKLLKSEVIEVLKKVIFAFSIISLIIGLMNCIMFFINTRYSISFCKECPFTYTLSHLNYTFNNFRNNYKNANLEEKCNNKRCLLYNENLNEKYAYSYLCNYNPTSNIYNEEVDIFKRKLPNGTEITSKFEFSYYELGINYRQTSFNNDIFYKYLDTCYTYSKFYICNRFTESKIYYNLKVGELCPDDNYLFLLYIICLLLAILEIIFAILLWCMEYSSLNVSLLYLNQNTIIRRNDSIYSTRTNTEKTNNNNENFKKEPTLVIIMPLGEGNSNNNIKLNIQNSENNINDKEKKDKKIIISSSVIIRESDRINLHKRNHDIKNKKSNENKK